MPQDKNEIAKEFVQNQERANPIFDESEVPENVVTETPHSIGPPIKNNQTGLTPEQELNIPEIGWKKIPLENLPTQGLFYPDRTSIEIKSATVAEIRHFSTMDENDFFEVNDTLNLVIEKCCRIKMPNKMATFRDLKETDRFYLLFCIREFTFKEGENKLFIDVEDPQTGLIEKVEMTKEKFSYYSLSEKIMEYYSTDQKCFVFRTKNSGIIPLYVPSIGISNFLFQHVREKINNREYYDKTFMKIAPFVFSDWRVLNKDSFKKAEQESLTWDMKKIAIVTQLIEKIELGVKLEMKHTVKSGAEVTKELQFQGGVKSLFVISDIFGELL
jgi:hypothetical protein